jgi:hypothetical protein
MKKEDLGTKIRNWYESYNNCPPWSAMFGFMARELKAQREELKDTCNIKITCALTNQLNQLDKDFQEWFKNGTEPVENWWKAKLNNI